MQPKNTTSPPSSTKQATTLKSNPNSTQNALQIAEIRDGVVIMHDGTFRTVLMVKSINFDLMSPREKEAVEQAYQNFLNSLYFDIQIYVHSTKIDIAPYLDKLAKMRTEQNNMLLAVMMDDYLEFMVNIADNTNLMDKKFYVIIPYIGDHELKDIQKKSKSIFSSLFGQKESIITINEATLETAKVELKNRAETVLSGLLQCGVQGITLDTQELIELYYDSYNPDTATRQKLENFNELSTPYVTKGIGEAPQPQLNPELPQ